MNHKLEAINFKEFVEYQLKPFRDIEDRERKLIVLAFCVWLIMFGGLILYLIW